LSTDDPQVPDDFVEPPDEGGNGSRNDGISGRSIEDELKSSYLVYAMSVIVSRALPDVRDGLKPSQRRILVAMSDLNLTPGAGRVKCAKISGDTSGNYHPHGESVIYPTLVRMAQEWNMRHVLIDKQGNFGSIAGLPPAAMRYTEARLSPVASMLLDDLKMDTVDFVPTYDERRQEPTVLPSKFPNLLVNGSSGIAVSMATSIPPHNLGEVCDALMLVLEKPECSIDEIMEVLPGPDFPTGGIICGRTGIRRAYMTGRSVITVRARCAIEQVKNKKNRYQIVVSEIPFQQTRDNVVEKIAALVNGDRIKGISGIRDLSDLKEPVKLIIDISSNADAEIVLNQLYQFSPLQSSFSMIFLALVDGKPRELTIKGMLEEFIRHRIHVIRRRTQFLLAKARRRKHIIEGLMLALADIDKIIKIIRGSKTQVEAKTGLMGVECPASMMQRALGERGFTEFQTDRGVAEIYFLTAVQADAVLRMTLGQLVNLEQEKLGNEYNDLLTEIHGYLEILSDENNIRRIIKDDLLEIQRKHADARRTELSGEELGEIDMEDLITEENMVVSISHKGYIKRTPVSTYRAQRRGGKGLKGAKTEEEDPIEHLFAASTHDYLLFFTNKGRVYWQKVYGLPQLSRESRGRAIVNLLNLDEGENIRDCRAVRDFDQPDHYLVMATKRGLIKKTNLKAYSRPKKGGIIAIKLREDDELINVNIAKAGDELVLSSANGMAIRFAESDARPMGRNTSGVKGISLREGDELVGMVIADPDATLLTVCENGYGKRTNFGPNATEDEAEVAEQDDIASGNRYRTQRRGGKGVRDIKTTERNGGVVSVCRVDDTEEILMMTSRGKIQRIAVDEISVIGRNTKGVRIMKMDEGDTLAAVVRVPPEDTEEEADVEVTPIAPAGTTAKQVAGEKVDEKADADALNDTNSGDMESDDMDSDDAVVDDTDHDEPQSINEEE
jgi:DNA gyrase subunit A